MNPSEAIRRLAGIRDDSTTSMTENVTLDNVAEFYAAMSVPDSQPVAGWTLSILDDGSVCELVAPTNTRFTMPSYKMKPDVWEWCQENMREDYWFLGMDYATPNHIQMFFTLEHDYILFKLRWG